MLEKKALSKCFDTKNVQAPPFTSSITLLRSIFSSFAPSCHKCVAIHDHAINGACTK